MNDFENNAEALRKVMGNIDAALIKEIERNKRIAEQLSKNPVFSKTTLVESPKLILSLVHLLYSMFLYLTATGSSVPDADTMISYIKRVLKYTCAGLYYDYHIVNATTLFLDNGYDRAMQFAIYANSPRHSKACEDKEKFAAEMVIGLNKIAVHKDVLNEILDEFKRVI